MSDATRACPICGAENPSRAKFCARCGASFQAAAGAPSTPGAARMGNPILPWFLALAALMVVQTVVIVLAVKQPQPAAGNQADMGNAQGPGFGGATPTASRAPDISNMTPREAADRLYERIAQASERGDSGQVTFFGPMAIQAYSRVTPLDPDARLHIGMIQLALRDPAAAMAQADSIARSAPTHLFGPLLRARTAEYQESPQIARQAFQRYLQLYDAEMGKDLDEYKQHASMLSQARIDAQAAR